MNSQLVFPLEFYSLFQIFPDSDGTFFDRWVAPHLGSCIFRCAGPETKRRGDLSSVAVAYVFRSVSSTVNDRYFSNMIYLAKYLYFLLQMLTNKCVFHSLCWIRVLLVRLNGTWNFFNELCPNVFFFTTGTVTTKYKTYWLLSKPYVILCNFKNMMGHEENKLVPLRRKGTHELCLNSASGPCHR